MSEINNKVNENTNRNIAITGMPRSGTTLTCFLINKTNDAIALHEPIQPQRALKGLSRENQLKKIKSFYDEQRTSLLSNGSAITKHREGLVPDNPIPNSQNSTSSLVLRDSNLTKGKVNFNKQLSASFLLAIKHPPLFTAMLPEIQEMYKTYVILRNPLAVMLSWNSVSFPISRGKIPTAQFIDSDLRKALNNESELYNRQGIIMHWFLNRFHQYIPVERCIKYEDIIATGGKILSNLGVSTENLNEPLSSKNTSKNYNRSAVEGLYNTIEKHYSDDFSAFYTLEEIGQLKDTILSP